MLMRFIDCRFVQSYIKPFKQFSVICPYDLCEHNACQYVHQKVNKIVFIRNYFSKTWRCLFSETLLNKLFKIKFFAWYFQINVMTSKLTLNSDRSFMANQVVLFLNDCLKALTLFLRSFCHIFFGTGYPNSAQIIKWPWNQIQILQYWRKQNFIFEILKIKKLSCDA